MKTKNRMRGETLMNKKLLLVVLSLGMLSLSANWAWVKGVWSVENPGLVSVGVALDPTSPQAALLSDLPLQATVCPDLMKALSSDRFGIVLADATPTSLAALAGHSEIVQKFTDRGGWLMLWGVTPDGLADFNKVVGVNHLLRPFVMEELQLPMHPDPLLRGLDRDNVMMKTDKNAEGWGGIKLRAKTWTYVLDGSDIAPYCTLPDSAYWGTPHATLGGDRYVPNLVNGFIDSWQLAFTIPTDKPDYLKWNMTFPRPEVVTRFSLSPQGEYQRIQKLRLTFIGSTAAPVEIDVPASGVDALRFDFPLPEFKATGITLEILKLSSNAASLTGIGNLWITVKRSDEFRDKVKQLLSLGVLNAYPQGKGGIVANQMRVDDTLSPEHRGKQAEILSVLLRNLGALPPVADAGQEKHATVAVNNVALVNADGSIAVDAFIHPEDDSDDTMAIRRALDYAMEHQVRTVRFGACTYHISSTITCRRANGLALVGAVKADGMPGTIIEEHIADSSDGWYQPFFFVVGADVTVRNFAFTCSKPVAMVAKIVEKGEKSITVEALPRYRDATETFNAWWNDPKGKRGFFSGFQLFDLEAAQPRDFVPVKDLFRFKKVPGTARWQTEGLTENPDVYVGEYINWEYHCAHETGGVFFNFCINPTAENLLGLNFPGSQANCNYCTGTILYKDLYSIPYDGYYTSNRASHNYIDFAGYDGTTAISDHVVHVTSARDDSYDGNSFSYAVMEIIDPQTVKVKIIDGSRPGGEQIPLIQVGDEAWIMHDALPRPYRCRLLAKPIQIAAVGETKPYESWYLFTFDHPLPPDVLKPNLHFTGKVNQGGSWILMPQLSYAAHTIIRNCVDLRNNSGNWHQTGDLLSENNFSLHQDYGGGNRCVWRNNEWLQICGAYGTYGPSIWNSVKDRGDAFPHYVITGNVFANKGRISANSINNLVIDRNAWIGNPRIQLGKDCESTISNNQTVAEDVTKNYLSNSDFASGRLDPWTTEAGEPVVIPTPGQGGHHSLQFPPGYHVVKTTITGLQENTYYRFGGIASGKNLSFKVTGFTPFGGALISDSIADSYLTFRTFKGITSATLYVTRRGGAGDSFLDDLTVHRLAVAVPPVDPVPPPDRTPPPLPETDGSYMLLDDSSPELHWSGADWETLSMFGQDNHHRFAYGNILHQTKVKDASITCDFTGSGVGLYAVRRRNYGTLTVRIDDGASESVPLNIGNDEQQLVYVKKGLPLGKHTLTVACFGDGTVNVDALRVYTTATVAEPSISDRLKDFSAVTDPPARLQSLRQLLGWLSLPPNQLAPDKAAKAYLLVLGAVKEPEEQELVLAELGNLKTAEAVRALEPLLSQVTAKQSVAQTMLKISRSLPVSEIEPLAPILLKAFEIKEGGSFAQKYAGYPESWLLSGPYFDGSNAGKLMDVVFPPEKADDTGSKWQPLNRVYLLSADPKQVNLGRVLGGENRVAYLQVKAYSPSKQEAVLEIKADDGDKVWLNGTPVHAAYGKEPEKVTATLEKGWNTIRMKVVQASYGWSASLRVCRTDGGTIEGLQFKAE